MRSKTVYPLPQIIQNIHFVELGLRNEKVTNDTFVPLYEMNLRFIYRNKSAFNAFLLYCNDPVFMAEFNRQCDLAVADGKENFLRWQKNAEDYLLSVSDRIA